MVMDPTHERLDSPFFGVFLGYLQYFRPRVLENLLRPVRNRVALGFLIAALLSCCIFFTRESHFLLTFGFTFLYLGFGGLMLLSLYVSDILPKHIAVPLGAIGTGFAYVGIYSYSIYLWHLAVAAWGRGLFHRLLHLQRTRLEQFIVYMIGSLIFGILMSKLNEFPVLKLRDRIFPPRQSLPAQVVSAKVEELPIPVRHSSV
jgi:peptidoglycan/LPS O-acetylase OafA/YrhL